MVDAGHIIAPTKTRVTGSSQKFEETERRMEKMSSWGQASSSGIRSLHPTAPFLTARRSSLSAPLFVPILVKISGSCTSVSSVSTTLEQFSELDQCKCRSRRRGRILSLRRKIWRAREMCWEVESWASPVSKVAGSAPRWMKLGFATVRG